MSPGTFKHGRQALTVQKSARDAVAAELDIVQDLSHVNERERFPTHGERCEFQQSAPHEVHDDEGGVGENARDAVVHKRESWAGSTQWNAGLALVITGDWKDAGNS